MKFSTHALQTSLLQEEPEPTRLLGETAEPEDTNRLSGQRAQVEAIMSDGAWHSLPGMAKELKQRFGTRYAETSISARILDLRRKGFTVEHKRIQPGSGLYLYRATQSGLPSAADLDAVAADMAVAEATA